MLRLTLLAPDIVQAILDARHPAALGLRDFMEPLPQEWPDQQAFVEHASGEHGCSKAPPKVRTILPGEVAATFATE